MSEEARIRVRGTSPEFEEIRLLEPRSSKGRDFHPSPVNDLPVRTNPLCGTLGARSRYGRVPY